MARVKTLQGTCVLCGRSVSKSGMAAHLQSCMARSQEVLDAPRPVRKNRGTAYHLVVDAAPYWLHLEILADATLEDLDTFLRELWLECCGHMSQFVINGTDYLRETDSLDDWPEDEEESVLDGWFDAEEAFAEEMEAEEREGEDDDTAPTRLVHLMDEEEDWEYAAFDMDVTLGRLLSAGLSFDYEYDFGSTTSLRIRVLEEEVARWESGAVRLLARNEAPYLACATCGAPATHICTECAAEGEAGGLLCETCVLRHGTPVDMLLPVVNSPRSGTCGYEG